MISFIKKNKNLIIIAIAVLIASIPAFNITKVFHHDDLSFHILRIEGLIESLKTLQFPYRINPVANLMYGSADPIMYPHLLVYFHTLLYLIFHNFEMVFNISIILLNVLAAYLMYYSSKEIFENSETSLIATIMILLVSYRITLIYDAWAFGEYVAMSFIPLATAGYINILRGKYNKWHQLFIGLFFILQTHIITIFYTSILLLIISFLLIKRIISDRKILFTYIKVVFLLILTNLWYIVPILMYVLSGEILRPAGNVKSDWALSSMMSLKDQFFVVWKRFTNIFTISPITSTHRQLTYLIIFALLFLIINKFVSVFKKNEVKEKKEGISNDKICKVFLLIFLFNFIVYLGVFSRCFLAYFVFFQKLFDLQQMEARELGRGLPLFIMAFANIYTTKIKNRMIRIIPIFVFACIPLFMFYVYNFSVSTHIHDYKDFSNGDYMLRGTLKGNTGLVIINDYKCRLPKDIFDGKVRLSDENVVLSNEKRSGLTYSFDYTINDYDAEKKYDVSIPLFAYDGYVAKTSKGKKLRIKSGDNCLITIPLANEEGKITVKFVERPLWLLCDIISLISILFILLCGFIFRKRQSNKV